MHFDNLPILFILAISLIGNNFTVSIAALVLLLIKLLGLDSWLPVIESKGINVGVAILTAAVLVPVVSGRVDGNSIANVFKSLAGIIAVLTGLLVPDCRAGRALHEVFARSGNGTDDRHADRRVLFPWAGGGAADCRQRSCAGTGAAEA
jgi:uncharacterized membrane protein (DUF441 family)